MKILCLAVGKRHDTAIAAAIEEYTARLQRSAKTEWQLLAPPKAAVTPAEQKSLESRALLAALKSDDMVIVLDERGLLWTTPRFAAQLDTFRQHGVGRVVFVIGGAHGVTDALRARAAYVWALSPLVFPHQIVRLLLVEQLYRAFSIIKGDPYHHE